LGAGCPQGRLATAASASRIRSGRKRFRSIGFVEREAWAAALLAGSLRKRVVAGYRAGSRKRQRANSHYPSGAGP